MPNCINFVAVKTGAEAELSSRATLRRNPNKAPVPPMNPLPHKPNRFAPRAREVSEPKRILSPASSSILGQVKPAPPEPTNAELMAFLLKNFPNSK